MFARFAFLVFIIAISLWSQLSVNAERTAVVGRPPRYRTLYACEGSSLEIVCEEGTHINLIRANFGRFSISVCNDNGNVEWSVDCMSHRSFRVMQESCGHKRSCKLPASANVFGDPCVGTLKYLEAHYQCMPDYPQYATTRPHHLVKNPLIPLYESSSNDNKNADTASSPHPRIIFPETYNNNNNNNNPPIITSPAVAVSNSKELDNVKVITTKKSSTESSVGTAQESDNNYPRFNDNDIPPVVSDNETPILLSEEEKQIESNDDINKHNFAQFSSSSTTEAANVVHKDVDDSDDDEEQSETINSGNDSNYHNSHHLSDDHCPQNYSRGLFWNWTLAGHVAVQPCPGGATGFARWSCTNWHGIPSWTPPLPDMSDCSSLWVSHLENRINSGIESVVSLGEELAKNCREKLLYGGDLFRVTDIINQLVSRMEAALEETHNDHNQHVVRELLNSVQDVVSNLLDDNQLESWMELSFGDQRSAISSMMHALERTALLLAETKLQTSDYIRAHHNIFLSVNVRLVSSISDGINLPPISDSHEMPLTVSSIANCVHIPQQVVIENSQNGLFKVVFVMYKKIAKLLKPDMEAYDHYPLMMTPDGGITRVNVSRVINSDVIGVLINRERVTPLSEPFEYTLRHSMVNNVTNAKCVFWDVDRREWSQQGCQTVMLNETHTKCQCNHLTHFAVLMDVSDTPMSFTNELILRVITFIGCTISIICLTATFITLISFRSLKSDRNTIHTNLCLCLIISESIFLLGISQTQNKLICGLIAISLHYFFLASFLWMFFEGFQLYVMLVEVFEHEKSRINWYYILSYGVPAVMVIISAIIDPLSYGTSKYCWLRSDNYFIWCFVGPVIAILLANLVFLAIAITTMCRHVPHFGNKAKEQTKLTNAKIWIRGSLALVFLLGLTWTFGVLYLSRETLFMAYLFTIANSLQGLFIFVFICLTNEKVRHEYRKLLSMMNITPVCLDTTQSKTQDTERHQMPNSSSLEAHRSSLFLNTSNSSNTKDSSMTTTITTTSGASNSQPLISAPVNGMSMSGSAIPVTIETPTMRRSAQKYYLTDDSSDYGCKRLEHQYQKHCRDVYGLHGHHSHLMSHPPSFIEHIYECIDEDPYVAKLLLPAIQRSLDGQHARTLSDSSRHSDNRPLIASASPRNQNYRLQTANTGHHLPAIVRDNTANKTTIICPSQPSVALLNGDHVICCTLNDHQLCDHQTVNQMLNPTRQQFLVANNLNNLNSTSKSRHLSSDC